MARGNSGRIVIEVSPKFKDDLYVALARTKLTLTDWFTQEAKRFIRSQDQPYLFEDASGEGENPNPHED
jgi:hypothetical protein